MEVDNMNPLDCMICQKTLSQPVIMPCGHTICKSHVTECSTSVYCRVCDVNHAKPDSGSSFLPKILVENLLKRKLQDIDLGEDHKNALKLTRIRKTFARGQTNA